MPPSGKYVWNYHRCSLCHDYLVTVRAVEGEVYAKFPCQTEGCRGEQVSAMDAPVVDWPATIIRTAVGEFYRPGSGLLLDLKRQAPRLWTWVTQHNGLILRKLEEPIVWSEKNDGYPKVARFSLT